MEESIEKEGHFSEQEFRFRSRYASRDRLWNLGVWDFGVLEKQPKITEKNEKTKKSITKTGKDFCNLGVLRSKSN